MKQARIGAIDRPANQTLPERSDVTTPLAVAAGLAMAPAVALGLARFAYALLLPAMRADLGWTYADAGAMNTANAVGYLAGALLAAPIGKRIGLRPALLAGLLLTSIAIAGSGLTGNFDALLTLRLIAGVTGAVAFVAGGGLAAAAAKGGGPGRAPLVLGIYFGGGGIGVAASALCVPAALTRFGWQGGWLALGVLGLVATLFGVLAARHAPIPSSDSGTSAGGGWSARFMAPKLAAYVLFGAGYIAYATFIIAYLRTAEHFTATQVTVFWAVLGLSAVVAAFAWGPVLARLKGGWGAALTIWVVALGAVIPLVSPGAVSAYASAVVFGFSFLAVIAAVTSFARRAARPHAWTSAIAALTIAFGIGQSVGPVLSGALSDGANGLRTGLWLSVVILIVSGAVVTRQAEPEAQDA